MTISEKISYNAVCDFFEGKNDLTDDLNKLCTENPAFGILNEIEKLSMDLPVLTNYPNFDFHTIEKHRVDGDFILKV